MRLRPRPEDRRPDPEPLATDDRRVVMVGIVIWLALLGAALIGHDRLAAQGNTWWVWTPVAGIVLGLYALWSIRRR